MRYRRDFRLRPQTDAERVRELEDEMEAHIAMRAEELEHAGMPAARAQAEARARFGSASDVIDNARARDRRLGRLDHLDEVVRDARVAWRRARSAPLATLLTVLTFALGIGLTTATYTFVDHVLLRPLPYPEPERLVLLQGMDSVGNAVTEVSYSNWLDWTERSRTLEASAVHMARELSVARDAASYHVPAQLVSPSFFDVFRTPMLLGRGFAADDAQSAGAAVVVSEAFWRRELGASPSLAGATVLVEHEPHSVIGVVPSGQEYPGGTEVWVAITRPPARGTLRNHINWRAVGRLQPGVSMDEAQAELSATARAIQLTDPSSDYSYGVPMRSLQHAVVGDYETYLELLMGAVLFVLLIACANLAALNYARGATRRDEVSVRRALGATRGRVARQLVTEQILLAAAGSVLGVLLALWATRVVALSLAAQLPRVQEIAVDARVLGAALLVTVIAAVLSAAAPAWRTAATDLRGHMQTRGALRGGRGTPGAVLVACEVALAVLLLTGGALLVRSFSTLVSRDLGFDPAGVALGGVVLSAPQYRGDTEAQLAFWERLLAGMRADPALTDVALANWVPGSGGGASYLVVEGSGEAPGGATYRAVSDDYFAALRIPLVLGRTFERGDQPNTQRVAVVDRGLAERAWPGENPIGRRIKLPGMEGSHDDAPWVTIIGVVGDVRHQGYEGDLRPSVFVLYRQVPVWSPSLNVVARHVSGDAAQARTLIGDHVRRLDGSLAVRASLLEEQLGELLATRRITMSVLSGFGVVALLLAALGIYGLLSFAVAQRTAEIGIRAALGASRGGIVRMVLRNAALVVGLGLGAGLIAAYWLTQLMQALLIDITNADVVSYITAAGVLAIVAAIAALVPAWRAARVDPLTALRG